MQLFGLFICTQSALHVSGDVFAHHQEHLTIFRASDIVHVCCCRSVSWTRWNLVPSRPWHRLAAMEVNYIRSCKYSQVLLMMGENIAWNMSSWLGTNKDTKKLHHVGHQLWIILNYGNQTAPTEDWVPAAAAEGHNGPLHSWGVTEYGWSASPLPSLQLSQHRDEHLTFWSLVHSSLCQLGSS